MIKLSSLQKRYLFGEFYALYFVCLIGGGTLLTLPDEYVGYRNFAATLLLIAVLISFFQSTLMVLHYSFRATFRKSVMYALVLSLLSLVLFAIGATVLSNK
jgi:Na+-driven multidrug efflux pump